MAKRITQGQAVEAAKALNASPNGRKFIGWVLQECGYGRSLSALDPRVQDANVAKHDIAVGIVQLLETKGEK